MSNFAFLCSAVLWFVATAAFAQDGGLTLPDQQDAPVTLSIPQGSGWTPGIEPPFQVFIGDETACCRGKTALAGRYETAKGSVSFTPMFPFLLGQTYTVFVPSQDGAGRRRTFTLGEDAAGQLPEVIAILPSGPEIPENTLRFYIEFATPMQPHRATDFIGLFDATGARDTAAFMTFKQELWNADRTRLTLLMDPGRIKRGVATNLDLGAALEDGARYAIRVSEGWPGATGGETKHSFERGFRVGPPLRTRPSTEAWSISAPRAASRDALVLTFDRPFDRIQLEHSLVVRDADGNRIKGTVEIMRHETAWRFVPFEKWGVGDVTIVVDARLEDVAGNNFRETLDHALGSAPREIEQIRLAVPLAR